MNLEDILELLKPRPSFWFRVWMFLFLLFNRKEGMRLFETLIEEVKALEEISRQTEKTYQRLLKHLKSQMQ